MSSQSFHKLITTRMLLSYFLTLESFSHTLKSHLESSFKTALGVRWQYISPKNWQYIHLMRYLGNAICAFLKKWTYFHLFYCIFFSSFFFHFFSFFHVFSFFFIFFCCTFVLLLFLISASITNINTKVPLQS